MAQPPDIAPYALDLDGDSRISVLDMTILAQHFTETVGTPEGGCYSTGTYATPLSVEGYTFDRYILVPEGHPVSVGTQTNLAPC